MEWPENKWVTRVITPASGVITLLWTGRGPPCTVVFWLLPVEEHHKSVSSPDSFLSILCEQSVSGSPKAYPTISQAWDHQVWTFETYNQQPGSSSRDLVCTSTWPFQGFKWLPFGEPKGHFEEAGKWSFANLLSRTIISNMFSFFLVSHRSALFKCPSLQKWSKMKIWGHRWWTKIISIQILPHTINITNV